MIRVLHVLDVLRPSGAETCLRIAGGLWEGLGVQADVLATGDELGPYAAELREAGHRTGHLPLDPFSTFARNFPRLVHREGYDVVHLHIERANAYVAALAMFGGARVVQHVHNVFAFDGSLRVERAVQRRLMRAAGIPFLSVSADVVDNERDRFGNDSMEFLNWADLDRFTPEPARRSEVRRMFGVADDTFVAVSVANCHDFKNHLTMIDAIAQMDGDVHWLHVGAGALQDEEKARAAALGVADRISFLGQRDPLDALHAADVFVMNSHYEGQGISAIEGLAAGLPAVLADVPGLRNLRAMDVPARWCGTDADSLAAALDATRRDGMPTGQLEVMRQTFDPERRVTMLVQVYRDVTSTRTPPRTAVESLVGQRTDPAGPLRVGILSPLYTAALLPLLDGDTTDVPPGIGGPNPTDLVVSLVELGHHVTAVTMDESIDEPRRYHGPLLDLVVVPRRSGRRARNLYATERAHLAAELDRMEVDIVHAHWTYEFAMAALKADVPQLVTVRDWSPQVVRYNPIPYWVIKALMNFSVLAHRPALTTPAPDIVVKLRRFGLAARHIPNGLRLDHTGVANARTAPRDPPTILSVNNGFEGRKNSSTLLQAFQQVRRRHRGATLRMVGIEHGPGGAAHEWAISRQMDDGVQFLGQLTRTEILELMRDADILAHPARKEPFGLVLIEAMSQGMPVVAGLRSGGPEFILGDGAFGILVDVDDAGALARGIEAYLDDHALYARMSDIGRSRVADAFDSHRNAEQYVKAYRDLLAGAW